DQPCAKGWPLSGGSGHGVAGSIFMVAREVTQHRSDMRPGEIVWMFPVLTVTQDDLELGQNALDGRGRCLW
ncbi:hypothetical protein, partial [Mesorhizobium sp. M2A.F.Ca.ET.067.02.1.1]|uniref:hypothetical protein n=1 Tax=Mesorhizobium sp. M2A.F.Ca.ET.067.02.1.1 TaxID=2496749 RepID=UPI001AECAF57